MQVTTTELAGVLILQPRAFGDARGFFMESFNEQAFWEATGRTDLRFVQDNHSRSRRGVLRGLHYQLAPHAQGKLVRVVRGAVFDVAADIAWPQVEGGPSLSPKDASSPSLQLARR